jgi:hypothetical protein
VLVPDIERFGERTKPPANKDCSGHARPEKIIAY